MRRPWIACAVLALALLKTTLLMGDLTQDQADQRMASVWQGTSQIPYRQVSVYYDPHTPVYSGILR